MPRDLELVYPPSEEPPSFAGDDELRSLAAAGLGVALDSIAVARLRRISFDARPRHRVWRIALTAWRRGEQPPPAPATTPPTFARPRQDAPRVAVVGSGPAGLFCALDLLAAGLNVSLFERGRDVRARRRSLQLLNRGEGVDPDSNYCFGEGGAGTYSDGKLYTRTGTRESVRAVLETLVAHGAPAEILVSWRPHVGSNRLPGVVQALRATIQRSGGAVRFRTRVEQLETTPGQGRPRVRGLRARDLASGAELHQACDALVLAAGHSALDSLLLAARAGARLEPKGFAMGLRIEHPQAWLDRQQYGGLRESCELPPAFYELATQREGRGVYSFCMCPGGFIVPATTESGRVVINGMSLARRDSPFASSGLVVQIEPEDWCQPAGASWGWQELLGRARALGRPLGLELPAELPHEPGDDPCFGLRLQLALEALAGGLGGGRNRAPGQRADLAAARAREPGPALATSYRPGVTPCDLAELLPRGMRERLAGALGELDGRLPGFASEHGQLLGVESRTSSPVRIARDAETLASREVPGLYPAGEGAGYAGGIVSAALDGRRVAAALAAALAPGR